MATTNPDFRARSGETSIRNTSHLPCLTRRLCGVRQFGHHEAHGTNNLSQCSRSGDAQHISRCTRARALRSGDVLLLCTRRLLVLRCTVSFLDPCYSRYQSFACCLARRFHRFFYRARRNRLFLVGTARSVWTSTAVDALLAFSSSPPTRHCCRHCPLLPTQKIAHSVTPANHIRWPLNFNVSHMQKWKLNEADVYEMGGGSSMKSHGQPAKTKRSVEVKLVHRPTGISVAQSSPVESMSRPEAAKMREQLRADLFPKLEELVAKHLRIPGR